MGRRFYRKILKFFLISAFVFTNACPHALADPPERFGAVRAPLKLKPWELEGAQHQHLIDHPEFKGIVNDAPASWKNLPAFPARGGNPIFGIWAVGPNGDFIFAKNTWIFRTNEGSLVQVPDEDAIEVHGRLVGKVKNADGSTSVLTDLVGDLGHPTLAKEFENNKDLKLRLGGDFKLDYPADGTPRIHINNISGRYLDNGYGTLLGARKELQAAKVFLEKTYQFKPEQVLVSNFYGKAPTTRSDRFPEKVVLVSGGTDGIGLEICREYKAKGYKVATFGRDPEKIARWKKEFGSSHRIVKLSKMDYGELEKFVNTTESSLGKIQVLINNAGTSGPFGPIGESTGKAIAETIQTNLVGTINLSSIVVDRMEKQGTKGIIINLSSGASRGVQGGSIYAASKAGVNAFTTSANLEYENAGIKFFAFNPGPVDTGNQAKLRKADPQKFPYQEKMRDMKERGLLESPVNTAKQISYLADNPEEFKAGTMVEFTAVNDKINELKPQENIAKAIEKVLPPEALSASRGTIEGFYSKNFSADLSQSGMPEIFVNGKTLGKPKNLDELFTTLEKLHHGIQNSISDPALVQIGRLKMKIQRKMLGEGMAGVVYKVVGTGEAIKISKPHAIGVKSTLDEKNLSPRIKRLLEIEDIAIPKDISFDPFGIYHLKEEISDGETLTETLIRKGIIRLEKSSSGSYSASLSNKEFRASLRNDPTLKRVHSEIDKFLHLRAKYPELISDIGPDNLYVSYEDLNKTKIKSIHLLDIGPSGPVTRAKFDAAKGFDDYLNISEGLTNRYLETGVLDSEKLESLLKKNEVHSQIVAEPCVFKNLLERMIPFP
jgi:NAD(P)-dependent dehydrogenase (short-subunit alcohol dehydrogenase family)